jgi:hypothetical protein
MAALEGVKSGRERESSEVHIFVISVFSFSLWLYIYIYIYIYIHTPSLGIHINTSVNAIFMAHKLNTAKSYFDITDCRHVHYKCAKTLQSSLSCYGGVDRQRQLRCSYCFS